MAEEGAEKSPTIRASIQYCPECVEKCKKRLAELQKEAQELVNDHGDPLKYGDEINRRITQKYAEMYSNNSNLHWVGAATYVSKQVGCNLRQAQRLIDESDGFFFNLGSRATGATKADAEGTKRLLVRGNQEIFSDIYPMYRLFEEDPDCVTKYGKDVLPKGSDRVIDGFEKYQDGDLKGAMMDHAWYEQKAVLQDRVFDAVANATDKVHFQNALKANDSLGAIADRVFNIVGYSREAQVSFTPECEASYPTFMMKTPGDFTDFNTRWKSAVNTLNRYHDLMNAWPVRLKEGIDAILGNMRNNRLPIFE